MTPPSTSDTNPTENHCQPDPNPAATYLAPHPTTKQPPLPQTTDHMYHAITPVIPSNLPHHHPHDQTTSIHSLPNSHNSKPPITTVPIWVHHHDPFTFLQTADIQWTIRPWTCWPSLMKPLSTEISSSPSHLATLFQLINPCLWASTISPHIVTIMLSSKSYQLWLSLVTFLYWWIYQNVGITIISPPKYSSLLVDSPSQT